MSVPSWWCLGGPHQRHQPEDSVNSHKNARLTAAGRAVLARGGLRRRADSAGGARNGRERTHRAEWVARYRTQGVAGLVDRSSRPLRSPRALSRPKRRQISYVASPPRRALHRARDDRQRQCESKSHIFRCPAYARCPSSSLTSATAGHHRPPSHAPKPILSPLISSDSVLAAKYSKRYPKWR